MHHTLALYLTFFVFFSKSKDKNSLDCTQFFDESIDSSKTLELINSISEYLL